MIWSWWSLLSGLDRLRPLCSTVWPVPDKVTVPTTPSSARLTESELSRSVPLLAMPAPAPASVTTSWLWLMAYIGLSANAAEPPITSASPLSITSPAACALIAKQSSRVQVPLPTVKAGAI